MASGMKIWLAACLGGMAVAAVLLLPPRSAAHMRSERDEGPDRYRAAAIERVRLFGEAGHLRDGLRVLRAQDSLDVRLADARARGERWFVDFPDDLARHPEARAFRDATASDLADLGRQERGARAIVGVLVVPSTFGAESHGTTGEEYTYAGALDDGTPYCVRVVWNPGEAALGTFAQPWSGGPLGLCRHWARFGAPGPRVAQWLEEGGYAVARGTGVEYLRRMFRYDPIPLGFDAAPFASESAQRILLSAADCLGGDDAVCSALALDPAMTADPEFTRLDRLREVTDVVAPRGRHLRGSSIAAPYFLDELERIEGPEAVSRFWTSTRTVEAAFREATGSHPGPWVRSWIESLGIQPLAGSGPTLSARTTGLSLLVLLGLFGVGVALHARREVA